MYSLNDTWGFPCEFPHSEIFGSQDRKSTRRSSDLIPGYVRLPEAYRSLSRPSSAPDAKAFTMRPL